MFWKKQSHKPAGGKPALIWLIMLIGIALAIVAHSVFGSTAKIVPVQEAIADRPPGTSAPAESAEPPQGLQSRLEQLTATSPGKTVVLVRAIDEQWVAGVRGATIFPQGSLRRIWLGAALLEAVDYGEVSLDQRVPLLASGSHRSARSEQVRSLLRQAVAEDDRVAQDEILAGLTGPAGMAAWLERRQFGEIAFGPSNRDMTRIGSGKAGQGTPLDGATPDGVAFALGELFAGKVLKEETTAILLQQFAQHQGVEDAAGWQILRLKGASPLIGPVASAGGVALVRSRTGQRYVVVVFASGSGEPSKSRDRLLADAVAALQRS